MRSRASARVFLFIYLSTVIFVSLSITQTYTYNVAAGMLPGKLRNNAFAKIIENESSDVYDYIPRNNNCPCVKFY